MKVSTKFEVDTTIRCLCYDVIAAQKLRDLAILTFDLLTLVGGHTWRVMWSPSPRLHNGMPRRRIQGQCQRHGASEVPKIALF